MPRADLALVLSGGGARAAYQVGALAALAESSPELEIPIITGVSAGAINAVYLAAHAGPLRNAVQALQGEWLRLTADRVYRVRPVHVSRALIRSLLHFATGAEAGPASLRGVMEVTPLRRFLSGCMDVRGIAENITRGRLRAAALSSTSYTTGETITFVQGAPDVPMWQRHMRRSVRAALTLDHVLASSAIPIIFPAVKMDGAFYGDGSIRQTAPLAPAVHLGARRIIAIAMRAQRPPPSEPAAAPGDYPAAVQVLGLLLHSIFLDSLDADAERLERVNDLLRLLPPSHAPTGLRPVDLLMLRPSRDLGRLAREFRVELPKLVALALRSMGSRRVQASDFLSYLLFQPGFISAVMELGYDDTRGNWKRIEAFLATA